MRVVDTRGAQRELEGSVTSVVNAEVRIGLHLVAGPTAGVLTQLTGSFRFGSETLRY